MIEQALKYHSLGFRVIPTGSDKRPLCKWKQYRERQTSDDVKQIFSIEGAKGMAVLTGIDGLECIDIDTKYDVKGRLFSRYISYIEKFESVNVSDLVIQATPSGGWHFFYRCEYNDGNRKLARRPATHQELLAANTEQDRKEKELQKDNPSAKLKRFTNLEQLPSVLIETRGVGGYVLIDPSPGYQIQEGKRLSDIPNLSIEQRAVLINSAVAMNELITESELSHIDREVNQQIKKTKEKYKNPDMVTCWDAYNESNDFLGCLRGFGWQEIPSMETNDRIYFTRPGKQFGLSADFHKDKKLFKCWSTSTIFEDQKAYTPFSVFALLEHNGNSKEAARELYRLGFGDRFVKDNGEVVDIAKPKEKNKIYKFDLGNPPLMAPHSLSVVLDGVEYPIAGEGNIVCFVGKEKAGKTTIIACPIASALDEASEKLGFKLDLKGKDILFIDTEQPVNNFYKTQKFIHSLARKTQNVGSYSAYSLREYSVQERIAWIDTYLKGKENIGLIIIDGCVDLCTDFNSVEASTETVQQLMTWTEQTGAMLFTALHLTKEMGYMKGHLGSILSAKCDSTIGIDRNLENQVGTVRCRLSRGFEPFPPFEFRNTKDRVPIFANSGFDVLGRPVDYFENQSLSNSAKYVSVEQQIAYEAADDLMARIAAGIDKNNDEELPF